MTYDHEQQAQIDLLKSWWNKYNKIITAVLAVGVLTYATWAGWQYYQKNQTTQASLLYEELQKAVFDKDHVKVKRAAGDIEQKFTRTPYAPMAALLAAKDAFENNDMPGAKAQLMYVLNNDQDPAFTALAKIRLAGILMDEKAFDDALRLLDKEFPQAFEVAVLDRKADVLVAKAQAKSANGVVVQKNEEARALYQKAFDKLDEKNPMRSIIQLKLDALGGAIIKQEGKAK